jgi:hypothetical protein
VGEHGHLAIDIIMDDDLPLQVMKPVKTARILRQGSSPGDRHGEEERVQSLIVEAFAEISAGGHDHPFLMLGNRREPRHRIPPFPLALATGERPASSAANTSLKIIVLRSSSLASAR